MALTSDTRQLIRSVIKRVHPDLFPSDQHEAERHTNAESLKLLNVYVDQLSNGWSVPRPTRLEFYVKDESGNLKHVRAQLSGTGNLSPLFYAFGLISSEQLSKSEGRQGGRDGASDTNFLAWLSEQVTEAVRTAEQHDTLKWNIRRLRSALEEKYVLSAVQVGAEYGASTSEQLLQLEALKVLEQCLFSLDAQEIDVEGISIQLYHPDACPKESTSYVDEKGLFHMRTSYMRPFIGDDGRVHLVADRGTIKQQLGGLELDRARALTQATYFWVRRVRELTPLVTALLGVRSVWCETKTEHSSQKFVLWAGYLLEKRDEIVPLMVGKSFSFSVIVHTDSQSPLISFHPSSPILNVSADCPPSQLLQFLLSKSGGEASEAASSAQLTRAKEEVLLEQVRQALGAKCVIKICMNDNVVEGARRLLENADQIRSAVDLNGCCLALDDCYEVWDSGFISIPYNFSVHELPERMRMLKAGQRPAAAAQGQSTSEGARGSVRGTVAAQSACSRSSRLLSPASPVPFQPLMRRGVASAAPRRGSLRLIAARQVLQRPVAIASLCRSALRRTGVMAAADAVSLRGCG